MFHRLALGAAAALLLAAPASAQTMARTYGSPGPNDTPQAGAVAPDGSLVMLGFFNNSQNSIAYFDPAGNVQWARNYGPFLTDVAVAPDGSILWQRTYQLQRRSGSQPLGAQGGFPRPAVLGTPARHPRE